MTASPSPPASSESRRRSKKEKWAVAAAASGEDAGAPGQQAAHRSHKSDRGSRSHPVAATTTPTSGSGAPGHFWAHYPSYRHGATDAAPWHQQQPPSPSPPPPRSARAPSSSSSRASANEAVPPRLVSPWSTTATSAHPNPHVTPPWEGIQPPRRGETEIEWYLGLPDPWPRSGPKGNRY